MNITADELKQLVVDRLQQMGFTLGEDGVLHLPDTNKDGLRKLHEPARQMELATRQDWLRRYLPDYLPFFANGLEVSPEQIQPALVEVTTERQHSPFRMARLLWSIPFSKGYGRRLRFLVMDEANGRLIGLLALQSPPLSFPARDRLFQYPPGLKTELVNQTMDIQTLGAVPPYNPLLGGKLVALAAASVVNSETESKVLKTVCTERALYDLPQIKAKREQAANAASRAEAGAARSEQERRSRLERASRLLLELGAETRKDLDRQAIAEMLPEFGKLTASDRGRLNQQRLDTVAQLRSLGDEAQRLETELHVDGTSLDEAVCVSEVERLELRKAICQQAAPILDRVRDNVLQAVLPSTLDYMRAMLPLLTAGRYHDAELDEETYKIRVWDAQVREYVEKDIYSGATQDQFSLALRLGFALAALPQERGARPGFIFLDEPTAGFDAQRRGSLVELLTQGELAQRFDQIFLVAPDGAFPENPFPHYVRLVEGQMVAENLSQRTGM